MQILHNGPPPIWFLSMSEQHYSWEPRQFWSTTVNTKCTVKTNDCYSKDQSAENNGRWHNTTNQVFITQGCNINPSVLLHISGLNKSLMYTKNYICQC